MVANSSLATCNDTSATLGALHHVHRKVPIPARFTAKSKGPESPPFLHGTRLLLAFRIVSSAYISEGWHSLYFGVFIHEPWSYYYMYGKLQLVQEQYIGKKRKIVGSTSPPALGPQSPAPYTLQLTAATNPLSLY